TTPGTSYATRPASPGSWRPGRGASRPRFPAARSRRSSRSRRRKPSPSSGWGSRWTTWFGSSPVHSRTSPARSARSTSTRASSRSWSASSTAKPRWSSASTRWPRSDPRRGRPERPFAPQEVNARNGQEEGSRGRQAADSSRPGDARPAGRDRPRAARREHHGVLPPVQRADPAARRPGDPGRAHDLRGSLLHLRDQAAAGGRAHQAGGRAGEGVGGAQPEQGRQDHARAAPQDRGAEDDRPERQRRRGGHADRGRDGPEHGRGGGRMTGKRYAQALELLEPEREYPPGEAIRLLKRFPEAKFDETVEVAFRLGVDPRKADQMVRGTVTLPHGTGRTVRVAAFATGEKAREAKEAGADVVGGDDLVEEVLKGNIEFDAAVATPDMMASVGKAGRVLGPRGLMPNPKAGTVTFDIGKAVQDIKGGKLEYKVDRTGNLHLVIGKRSFDEQKLIE